MLHRSVVNIRSKLNLVCPCTTHGCASMTREQRKRNYGGMEQTSILGSWAPSSNFLKTNGTVLFEQKRNAVSFCKGVAGVWRDLIFSALQHSADQSASVFRTSVSSQVLQALLSFTVVATPERCLPPPARKTKSDTPNKVYINSVRHLSNSPESALPVNKAALWKCMHLYNRNVHARNVAATIVLEYCICRLDSFEHVAIVSLSSFVFFWLNMLPVNVLDQHE